MRIHTSVKLLFILVLLATAQFSTTGATKVDPNEIINLDIIDPDSLLDEMSQKPLQKNLPKENSKEQISDEAIQTPSSETENDANSNQNQAPYLSTPFEVEPIDALLLTSNPLLIDLVYKDSPLKFEWKFEPDMNEILFGKEKSTLWTLPVIPKSELPSSAQIVEETRMYARKYLEREALPLYKIRYDQLPNADANSIQEIEGNKKVELYKGTDSTIEKPKLVVAKAQLGPWTHSANALAQFSQNSVSANWYQGGVNNFAVLGIIAGDLKYNDKKKVQWDNSFEWRMGFTSISGDALRFFNTNDDVFKISSKMGVKANGNFFYSTALDFSTQFFDSYKAVNSTEMRSSFLTPVRFNAGLGIDYKYKGILSLMVSPFSYKYIYVTAQDSVVKHNQFGIKENEYVLSELGSSFRATLSYSPTPELKLDSKFSFYTNYKSVEIDWELVCNFIINRFMSTRLSINPRFDNTIITDERVKMQYKQLLSVGFAHKFK